MRRRTLSAAAALVGLFAPAVPIDAQHQGHGAGPREVAACTDERSLRCGLFATPTLAPDGTLWVAWATSDRVYVASRPQPGRPFSTAVSVTDAPQRMDLGADGRPQIVVGDKGRVLVAWVIMKDERYNGQVLTAASDDHGRTFSAPRPISDNAASQRFISLARDAGGDIFAAWIDKRHGAAAQAAGQPFAGASLATAWSSDGGRTFSAARIVHDQMCECCRLGVVIAGPRRPVVLFRNIFAGERDHALLALDGNSGTVPVSRVSDEHWAIDACPHHGPSLAVGADGVYHAAWFSGGGDRTGLFYARSTDQGRTFPQQRALGHEGRQASRPFVLADGTRLWLAWKEFDGERTTVQAMSSADGGRSWTSPRVVAATADYSDHPTLLVLDGKAHLAWLTRTEGYLVQVLEPGS